MQKVLTFVFIGSIAAGAALAAQTGSAADLFQEALAYDEVKGDLPKAIAVYQAILERFAADRPVAARALLRMAEAYQKLGRAEARTIYERIVRDYADQREAVNEARARLLASESKATARRVLVGYAVGGGDPGSPSSDGRYITTGAGTGDLAVRDLATGVMHTLTDTGGWVASGGDHAVAPVISPDGRQIAWEWVIDRESRNELRVASFSGAEPVRPQTVLRQNTGDYIRRLAWTPDGRQLVAFRSMPDRSSQIAVITLADRSIRPIKSLGWFETDLLSVSPDGRYVAYDAPDGEVGSPRNIFVLALDGSREVVVARSPSNESHPVWSPDGSQLLFLSDRGGSNALWAVAVTDGRDAAAPKLLRDDIGALTRLMGITRAGVLYYWVPGSTRAETWIAELDRGRAVKPPAPLTERILTSNFGPALSRDGEQLAYYSSRAMSRDTSFKTLVIRSMRTGAERTVRLPDRVLTPQAKGPKWFPDNRSVLIHVKDAQGGGAGFYRLALDTGNTELLLHVPREAEEYDLSPDGRAVFYMLGGARAIRYDIAEGRETDLGPGVSKAAQAVSPDGRQVAMALVGGKVIVVPATGGAPREVFNPGEFLLGTGLMRNSLAWSPDSSYLLLMDARSGTLTRIPLDGGAREAVGIPHRTVRSPVVQPDGRKIIYSARAGEDQDSVWSLEGFLPASHVDASSR